MFILKYAHLKRKIYNNKKYINVLALYFVPASNLGPQIGYTG
jgi:hypothetical protein